METIDKNNEITENTISEDLNNEILINKVQTNTDNDKNNHGVNNIIENQHENLEANDEETIFSEQVNLNLEDSNTTNCLALTIQKDHKMVAVKNVFLRTLRMSWKVVVTTVTLALIKLFSS